MYLHMTKVAKWGNSLAVRIPEEVVRGAGMREGTAVEVSVEAHSVVVRHAKKNRRTLAELVARITPENRHEAIDWGRPMGKEAW